MLKKSDWIIIMCFLVVLEIVCCWAIDVSVSAMLAGPQAYLTNGWSTRSPMLIYHIALYILIISGFLQFIIGVHIILKEERN